MATTHDFSIVTPTETISGEFTIGDKGTASEIKLTATLSEEKVRCIMDTQRNLRDMYRHCGEITSISITEKT